MAKFRSTGKFEFEMSVTITEAEARALDALSGYDNNAFMEFFYKHMGRHYMEPHDAGMRLFLSSIRGEVAGHIARCDAAREAFANHGKPEESK
jgi:hypothetical protein